MFVAPTGYQAIFNPAIPYVGPINGGLKSGMSLYIQGSIPEEADSFFLNLQCGENEDSDIASHLNAHFDGWVVLNNCQGGEWGPEEKIDNLPFSKGSSFEVVILVKDDGYQFQVNGQDFCMFNHRLPVDTVSNLLIGGNVSIQKISIFGGGDPGDQGDGGNLPAICGPPVFYPATPYTLVIPGGLSAKQTILFRGLIPAGAYRFYLNLTVGSSQEVAFHFNPRVEEGEVVRNSYLQEYWGDEERDFSFNPFQEGQYCDISVRCGSQMFKVFVNGQHMCNFNHRYQDKSQIDTLELGGDFQVSYVCL
ncbi:hypothetical protein UPYG_G00193840 [Umbra pygmaea]|uniref:Galectin n=1 Tax=Umbra pygmaea TaxID=75934 RepID=A0ABD0WID2_UMBPY